MRARRIIEGAAFEPEAIRIAIEAFDAAWEEIADRFDPISQDAARELLASSIISATRQSSSDSASLRRAAIEAMTRAFPDRFATSSSIDKALGTGN